MDSLTPFHGIAGFDSGRSSHYAQTIFRFPLRSIASSLSDNLYTVGKVLELIEALKAEAKLLLIFLRSVTCIEVFEVATNGNHTLLFQTKVTDVFLKDLTQKRSDLVTKVKRSYDQHQYNGSEIHSFTARFDISTYDHRNVPGTARWLVANQVGSSLSAVRTASVKQKVFPWVGAALDLDNPCNGRIFCFLPMPIDAASKLPVHINGTFSLTDDRRSLKWPGVERRNDPTADWNTLLVKEVLPSCYASLLLEAKNSIPCGHFYRAWPNVASVQGSHWEGVLKPLLTSLILNQVIWCERQVQWLLPNHVIYIPQSEVKEVVLKTLTNCGIKLAEVPNTIHKAFKFCSLNVTEVSPRYVRNTIRRNVSSYRNFNSKDKMELLKYCWSDLNYNDFDQLELLPLANGTYISFQGAQAYFRPTPIYLCSKECPRFLLPNLDHKLVDVSLDTEVHEGLLSVARSNQTQLKVLDVHQVANLIDDAMPSRWRNVNIVHFPITEQFPGDWFEKFWKWVSNKEISLFKNKLLVPTQISGHLSPNQFAVIRLNELQSALYFPSYLGGVSQEVVSFLSKFNVWCCLQSKIPYFSHSQLSKYIQNFSGRSALDVISKNTNYSSVVLTQNEAQSLQNLLSSVVFNMNDFMVVRNLKVFTTATNSKGRLCSITDIINQSIFREAVMEPPNMLELITILPDTIYLLSAADNTQIQLLAKLGIRQEPETMFLEKYLFPKIKACCIIDHFIDGIMGCILNSYYSLSRQNTNITESIKGLKFVKDGSHKRNCPTELFNPKSKTVSQIFLGENVFPAGPYSHHIDVLQKCGLRDAVPPQEILDIIFSISGTKSSMPQPVNEIKVSRARAILAYIQTNDFKRMKRGSYKVHKSVERYGSHFPFDTALLLLSENRCWLPVLSRPPSNYPKCLPWKGTSYSSHFVSISDSTCFSCSSREQDAFTYGSQAFFTEPSVDSEIYQWLGNPEPTSCLCPHFCEIISKKDQIDPDMMLEIVCKVYAAMVEILKSENKHHIDSLKTIKHWIYIKKYNKFVDVKSVACSENQKFRHSTEPYLHILPDSITRYSSLFLHCGMNQSITKSQIVSILDTINFQINNKSLSPGSVQVWNMVMAILNWLTNNATEDISCESILVPIESSSEWPDLRRSDSLVYTDNAFLRDFIISSSEDDPDYCFVHSRISPNLAKCLKVSPLSKEMDVSEDTFSDAGQYEPLTVRLKNILKDYKDGVTIVKELIQNADDAEATEINICFDSRNHIVDQRRLFFPGMSESHGPALIVHNNSTFTNEDFENIQKLAAATKANKHLKIGKFGIGFCSVYHITDVPSFISRDRMYIFDPTLKHLGKEVKNPSQPGKKVMFLTKVIKKSLQLAPYERMFGFHTSESFEGTMFRFPFRSSPSELSSTCYSHSHVNELFDGIKQCGDKLLLFLQHVQKITIQQINEGDIQPVVLCELSKNTEALPLDLDQLYFTTAISLHKKEQLRSDTTTWLIAKSASKSNGKEAVAMVACSLSKSPEEDCAYSLNSNLKGEMFCYLPLSQATGLPVHVSCNFAVINNRRGIWTTAESSSSSDTEVLWNTFLMKNVIPKAHINLLCSLRDMHEENLLPKFKFYSLWPLQMELRIKNPFEEFVNSFYDRLVNEQLFYSECTLCWMNRSSCKFLLDNILCSTGTLDCVVEVVYHLDLPIVQLPQSYQQHLSQTSEDMDANDFVTTFFDNLEALSDEDILDSRDHVLQRMLEIYANPADYNIFPLLKVKFSSYECIPSVPDGNTLRKCVDLVHPQSPFAQLFDKSENRFPIPLLVSKTITVLALKAAGMMHDTLPWSLVIDRAQTISILYQKDREKALHRVNLLLTTLTKNVCDVQCTVGSTLQSISFLPVLHKPDNYPIEWAGDGHDLLSGQEMVLASMHSSIDNSLIAGSQVPIVNESLPKAGGCGRIDHKARELLKLRVSPSLAEVIKHLKIISQSSDKIDKAWITRSCIMIYEFINKILESGISCEEVSDMKTFPCLWNEQMFLSTESVAKHWRFPHGPYLYCVPESIVGKDYLVKALSIKIEFTIEHALISLKKMKEEFGETPIDVNCENLLADLIFILLSSFRSNPNLKNIIENMDVFLPDEDLVLYKSSELAYNDAGWAPKDENNKYVYKDITRGIAEVLGVRLVRSKLLDPFVSTNVYFSGTAFGQREELTRRIQNILRDYPFDITLLKELLQNTDDAKAKKMFIILDKRTHGTESLISENWQKLQGPALLVWNDSVFTEKDLKGIQELGLGSKRSESETIGQYGIGFNVVYHLTDCPSFITGGETLCIMDPHCMYADGATPLSPGRRYDSLTGNGFWNHFKDMSSSYLRSGLQNPPEGLQSGSLFRFPLRHSRELIELSNVLDQTCSDVEPLTADRLEAELRKWIPDMKRAMFFLNNVTEIKYMVIDSKSDEVRTEYHFTRSLPEAEVYESCILRLQDSLSNFNKVSSCPSSRVLYPLEITDNMSTDQKKEKWLIQQGVGNLKNNNMRWQYVKMVKPRHGIAAPLDVPVEVLAKEKQLFCFLPLPASSELPVHVNGSFILNSTRREIWNPTTPGVPDVKSTWNNNLFEAIASSYADFLVNCKKFYFKDTYLSWKTALNDLKRYCDIYPHDAANSSSDRRKLIFRDVYKILVQDNEAVLCVLLSKEKTGLENITMEWHSLISSQEAHQVYFWGEFKNRNIIHPILESIGMKITSTSNILHCIFNSHISNTTRKIPSVSPRTVFEYYSQISCYSARNGMTATSVSNTVFKDLKTFSIFLKCLLNIPLCVSKDRLNNNACLQQYQEAVSKVSHDGHFPSPPYSHFLLLSADCILRTFDENAKVFTSEYSNMFCADQDKFLHPSLRELDMNHSYFIRELSQEENQQYAINLVLQIFKNAVPREMVTSAVVDEASLVIDKQQLFKYWDVFKKDEVLKSYLPCVLKDIAMLLTLDDRLFTTNSEIVPMYLPREKISKEEEYAIEVFKKLNLPFLDDSVVLVQVDCPHLAKDADRVLKNVIKVNETTPLTSLLQKDDIHHLIEYFAKYLSTLQNMMHYIKSLPLFEDVTGAFQSIQANTAYLWPDSCSNGYNSWIAGYNTTFLKSDAHWTCLGSSQQLSVIVISQEQLYNQFIFTHPHFALMCEQDRCAHLMYIRDILFSGIDSYKRRQIHKRTSDHERQKIYEAQRFYGNLVSLRCIGATNAVLLPISSFCDHTKDIFCVFPDDFKILPECLKKKEWLSFFKKLNLKQSLSEAEYVKFCHKTAHREVQDIRKASGVLLEYLVTAGGSYQPHTLHQISSIAFVCIEKASKVDWVLPGSAQPNQLVKLSGSALLQFQHQLWTIRPLVHLPEFTKAMMDNLGVITKPSVTDVVSNLKNISKSCYAQDHLFTNYPPELMPRLNESKVSHLIEIIQKNFQCLSNDSNYTELSTLSCLPVHVDLNCKDGSKVALVKPNCVVRSYGKSKPFHPYLYELPKELQQNYLTLEKIGVLSELTISHMQIVLEKAFLRSDGQPLIANTETIVKLAINQIKDQLQLSKYASNSDKTSKDLTPLYLPDVENKLRMSTTLVYGDTFSYYGRLRLSLDDTSFYHFDISRDMYDTTASALCRRLPVGVRPIGLSQLCMLVPDKNCEIVQSSELASMLQSSFSDKNNSENLTKAITRFVVEHQQEALIQQEIEKIFGPMTVTTVNKLKAQIVMKSSKKIIEQTQADYIFDDSGHHLYVDSKIHKGRSDRIGSEIAWHILKSISPLMNGPLKRDTERVIIDFISDFLTASTTQREKMLEKYQIEGDTGSSSDYPDLHKLGAEIPSFLHGRLDQHPDNVYNPTEIVGYEVEEDKIIVAQVIYLIQSEVECSVYCKRYKIYVDEQDETGEEVSILKLYKFLDGLKKPQVTSSGIRDESRAIVPHQSDDNLVNLRASFHKLSATDKKKEICDQLKEIWKLPPDLKRTAIRRLYLRYHPDKNPDNVAEAEILFLFLQAQIAHLENKEPLDDPASDTRTSSSSTNATSTTWSRDFPKWDATARRHKQRRNRAQSSSAQREPFFVPFSRNERDIDKRNPTEGRRWVRQAEMDARVLCACLSQAKDTDGYAHVCFFGHQVAEKALKGGMYALCGMDVRKLESHQLSNNAHALRTVEPQAAQHLPDHSCPLEVYHLKTRYPSEWPGCKDVPSDHYHQRDAEDAKKHAEEVLRIVKSIMPRQAEE